MATAICQGKVLLLILEPMAPHGGIPHVTQQKIAAKLENS